MKMTPDSLPREGLPYWTFWLLLFIIFLLVAFIFLRDKDLRRRLSYLLSGGKRRLLRFRLQMRLKRETQRRAGFIKELGSTAWSLDVRQPASEPLFREIRALDDKRLSLRDERQGVLDRIETLGKKLEDLKVVSRNEAAREGERKKPLEIRWRELREKEAALEKEIKAAEKNGAGARPPAEAGAARLAQLREQRGALSADLEGVQKALEELDGRIADIREKARVQTKTLEAEVREWDRERSGLQEKIRETERLMDPLFNNLGAIVNEARPDHLGLIALYAKIDRLDKTMGDISVRIDSLR